MADHNCITLPQLALSLASHESEPNVAIGLAEGGVVVSNCAYFGNRGAVSPVKPTVTYPFEDSCREVSFVPSTSKLLAAPSSGKVLLFDSNRKKPVRSYELPPLKDESGIASASVLNCIDWNIVLAGDDSGGMHLFDIRTEAGIVASVLEQGDYISAITPVDQFSTKALLATSGDGTLCAYDMRIPPHPRLRLQYACDSFNDDLLSLAVLGSSPLAVAGTLSGALNIYNLRFLDKNCEAESVAHVDRFYGHPECVNAVLAFGNEGIVLTASSDGIIRVVDIPGKSLVGVLQYDHQDAEMGPDKGEEPVTPESRKKKAPSWPIERMVPVSGLLRPGFALLGHDNLIRFCDGAPLVDEDEAPEGDSIRNEECDVEKDSIEKQNLLLEAQAEFATSRRKKKRKGHGNEKKSTVPKDFFDNL